MLKFYNQSKVLLYIEQIESCKPVFLEIHPSMLCNHQCIWCRYGKSNQKLTLDEMNLIVDKYPTIKGVRITGGGEPLTNHNTMEFIKNCVQMGITVGIETNGELLDDKSVEVISKHCLYCRISLDAATAGTYKILHGSDHFEKTLDNINKLRQAGIKELGISYLVVEENVKEMLDLTNLRLPVDYIHFKPIIQGIDKRTRNLALLIAMHWEKTGLDPAIRYDRLENDDKNYPKTPCRVTRIIRLLGGDNIEYVCCEKAYQYKFKLSVWNGSTRECLSCRYSGYNEILDQYYKNTLTKELL